MGLRVKRTTFNVMLCLPVFAVVMYNLAPVSIAQDRAVYLDLINTGSALTFNSIGRFQDKFFWQSLSVLCSYFPFPKIVLPLFIITPYIVLTIKHLRLTSLLLFVGVVVLDRYFLAGFLNTSRSFTAVGYLLLVIFERQMMLRIVFIALAFLFHFKISLIAVLLYIISSIANVMFIYINKFLGFRTQLSILMVSVLIILVTCFKFTSLWNFSVPGSEQLTEVFAYHSLGSDMAGNIRILFPLLLISLPLIYNFKNQNLVLISYLFVVILYPEIVFIVRLFPLYIVLIWTSASLNQKYILSTVKVGYFLIFWYV